MKGFGWRKLLSRVIALAGLGMIGFFFLFGWEELNLGRHAQARADAIKALRSLILSERLYSKDHGGAVTTIECLRKPAACAKPLPSDKPYLDASWPGTGVAEYWTLRVHLDSKTTDGKVEKYAVTLVRNEADPFTRSSFCADSEGLVIETYGRAPGLRVCLCDRSRVSLYRDSEGLPRGREEALVFFGRAADQGNLDAQAIIGGIYLGGEGAPPDYERALSWFRKAAERGNPSAQYNLGFMYDKGLGVPRDRMQALVWALVVLDGADYDRSRPHPGEDSRNKAAELRQEIVTTLTPTESAQAQELAFKWEEARGRATRPEAPSEFVVDWVPPAR